MPFRYVDYGHWYKGNTHIHTTASDGGRTPAQVAALYAAAHYHFLFATDHWRMSEPLSAPHVCAPLGWAPLLWLDGIELDGCDERGRYYHIACLGRAKEITREMGFAPAVESAQAQGALLVLAHPYWTGNSFDDLKAFRFDGVEIYNHVCQWLNGKGDGRAFWSEMLREQPEMLAFAADDAHLKVEEPGWNGGWIMVNAPALSEGAILDAIRAGNFYSSCGPEFHQIECDGATVWVRTSPVQFARLVGPGSQGQRLGDFGDERMVESTFEVPAGWAYAYIEIEDDRGRRAWTNTLFTRNGRARGT
jgi:hypothetical protein